MDFHLNIRQTPRFGTTTYPKGYPTPVASHIEDINGIHGKINRHQDKDPQEKVEHGRHHRHHHIRTPFRHRNDPHENGNSHGNSAALQELPFIDPEEVARANGHNNSPLWIVIDNVVYDVTDFSNVHPGGRMPLKNFAGQSCSWQFHKIHSRKTLESYGQKLKIGRTSDVPNPYKEQNPGIFRQLWKSHHF